MRSVSALSTTAVLAALAAPGHAFWRMSCPGRIIDARMDPIVSPGAVSGHLHTVSGGSAFNFSMTYADTQKSACSSCAIKQDLSNYWTPALFYQTQDGKFQSVPQVGDGTGVYGGMTVYYLQRGGPNNDNLTAYPEGFRMLAGNPYKRAYTDDFAGQAVSFVCLDYNGNSSYYNKLPDKPCPDGIRAQVFFPSCWDGVNLDSSDHQSHMAYPTKYSYDNGPCPATHPVHMISVFYEIIWDTASFQWWTPNNTWQPFVFAMGDPTGYGMHGDFLNGWDVPTLQNATNICTNLSGRVEDCPVFNFFDSATMQGCIIPNQVVGEQTTGTMNKLPGCNPVQYTNATAATCSTNSTAQIGQAPKYNIDVPGWNYVGCARDDPNNRTLSADQWWDDSVTVEACMDYCGSKGYTYAGLEYANQCYCGNSVASARMPTPGVLGNCLTPCKGNSSEYCGGASVLSLYNLTSTFAQIPLGGTLQYACPYANNTNYTSASGTYTIDCGFDWIGNDLVVNTTQQSGNMTQCIDMCAATSKCNAVSLVGTNCYLKTAAISRKASNNVNAAHLVLNANGSPVTSSTTTSSATTTAASTTVAVTAGATYTSAPTCPMYNGTYYRASTNATFLIECGIDHTAGDMGSGSASSLKACVEMCASTQGCIDVSLSGSACYMKSKLGAAGSAAGILGAKLVVTGTTAAASSSSTPVSSSTAAATSSSAASQSQAKSAASSGSTTSAPTTTTTASNAGTLVTYTASTPTVTSTAAACPAANNTIYYDPSTNYKFVIECGIDHQAGDMGMVSANNLTSCVAACASTTGCVDVSLSGSACYMKSKLGKALVGGGLQGAALVATKRDAASATSVAVSSSTAASSGSSSSSGVASASTTPVMTTVGVPMATSH